ncbi:metal-dependent hydrolase [Candidatus Electrothrix sp.]|uniref:metal-dependent hydrolase n=1 Tax=Candidatus Electrothrix sp. TaxID=2170559 RepID=UPI004055CD65
MSPVTHLFIGWLTANTAQVNRRELIMITIAGIIPDADGLVIIGDFFAGKSKEQLELWSTYHHVLGHNIGFAFLVIMTAYLLARTRKLITALLAGISFHLHLLGDLIGSRGPDGHQWPIPYLQPFSESWQWVWQGQWALNSWQNILITILALGIIFSLAWKRGYSPLDMISSKADRMFILALRTRFGIPGNEDKEYREDSQALSND